MKAIATTGATYGSSIDAADEAAAAERLADEQRGDQPEDDRPAVPNTE